MNYKSFAVVAIIVSVLAGFVGTDARMTYEGDGFSFQYPASYIQTERPNEDAHIWFTSKETEAAFQEELKTLEVVGPRLLAVTFINDKDLDFGAITLEEELKWGPFEVRKMKRDLDNYDDLGYWSFSPECPVQYHIQESKYVFCDNTSSTNNDDDVTDVIKMMIATLK